MLGIHTPLTAMTITRPEAADFVTLQRVWSISQNRDEPAGRPRDGWWSIPNWATASRILTRDDDVIGFAAIEYQPGADAAEARLGLLPEHRRPALAERLIRTAVDLAQQAGAPLLRLYTPEQATWAIAPAHVWGFRPSRTQHLMVRVADATLLPTVSVAGVRIRHLREGEETVLLDALNRAWAGTWNFRPIMAAALADDLRGQRDGMLVAVEEADDTHIVGTVHALFDPAHQNPDGSPYAWISNLTTDPAWRGRGMGRALLAAGLTHLGERSAGSVVLGVDGNNAAAFQLYRSAGFTPISTVVIWEHALTSTR